MFLVGDAAHVHSGIGGPGLNLGMQDALNLAWKLAAAVTGQAPDGLLDSYHRERHPVGQRVLMHSQAQLALLSPGPGVTALRDLFGELLRQPEVVRHVTHLIPGAETRYDMRTPAPHPLTGGWVPDLMVRPVGPALPVDGADVRVAELMRRARPVLLLLTHPTHADPTHADGGGPADSGAPADGWTDRVDVVRATTADPPAGALLIRPDGYVAWAGDPESGREALHFALSTWFGAPTRRPADAVSA